MVLFFVTGRRCRNFGTRSRLYYNDQKIGHLTIHADVTMPSRVTGQKHLETRRSIAEEKMSPARFRSLKARILHDTLIRNLNKARKRLLLLKIHS